MIYPLSRSLCTSRNIKKLCREIRIWYRSLLIKRCREGRERLGMMEVVIGSMKERIVVAGVEDVRIQ